VPPAIAGQGYSVRLNDQFDTLNRAVWDDRMWYRGSAPPANSQYTDNGVLHIVSRRSQGYPEVEVTTHSANLAWRYGYFEARMNWTGGQGSWPAFWLISEGWADTASCSTPASEIDMMEGQGSTPNTLYGTIHTDSAGRCGGHRQNSNNWRNYPFSLANSWHIYAALWTPTQVCWYLDNVLSHCAPTYSDTDASPMHVILSQWAGGWEGGPNASTPNELHTEFDWVRVWQK
jgi:beta-glucanase (GH16 family)